MKQLKKLTEWRSEFQEELLKIYPEINEIRQIFFLIAMHVLQCGKTQIRLDLIEKKEISSTQNKEFKHLLNELKNHKPVQYLLRDIYFYNIHLKLNKNVLIPRAETEELVDWILSDTKGMSKLRILDIGTGSGCIALSLKKKLPNADIYALDSSLKALECAKENAYLNDLHIHFHQANILKGFPEDLPSFDIIVSNPPYIRPSEKRLMSKNVLKYEPASALFVPEKQPLIFYEKIANWILGKLTVKGVFYFEINQYLLKEIFSLLKKTGYKNVQFKTDAQGTVRMVKGLAGDF